MKNANKKILLASLLSLSILVGCSSGNSSSSKPSGETSQTSSGGGSTTDANPAQGAISYVASDYDERTEILGILESYAVKNNLTGITMYENGSYVMYDDAVVKGTNTYIPGYGFGIISEGYISEDLASESNTKWKRYYHSYETEDPKTINYQNDKGSVVGSLIGYVSGSYWTTQMNEFKDGYEWVGQLANSDRPIAVNADANGLATKYKFEVKVGSELKYRTGSTDATISQYNDREVQLEDYLTPYKIYYTQAYGMARGSENLTGSGSIKGTSAYYNASEDGFNESRWADVGIRAYTEDDKSYLEFTFNNPCNSFYAMYYLSSSMFAPVPEEFIETLGNGNFATGVASWGNYTDSGLTPVDTWLSTGPYYIENWETDVQIVFGKNELFTCQDEDRYKMAGVHFKILKAASTDSHAVINEFLAGNLHASGIPSDMLDTYKNDERTTRTTGDTTYKLNLNTCTQERWIELFGENGTITQTAVDGYWECEPAMSNDNFVSALSYAFNREEFADKYGYSPSANYFGSAYLSNPEDGIMYNTTQAHQDAVAKLQEGTSYGYNLEFAKTAFKKACEELIASGAYNEGDTISLEVAWMTASDEEEFHADVKNYWETAFNSCGGGLTLEVNFWAGSSWSDVYYQKMMVGQFDVGFGSVSGNPLNPLNFLEVLKSDNSSGYTLNWGPDTDVVSEDLEYDGKLWSFDSLWQAADTGAYLVDGHVTQLYSINESDQYLSASNFTVNEDGSAEVSIGVSIINQTNATCEVTGATIYAYLLNDAGTNVEYDEDACEYSVEETTGGTVVKVQLPKDIVDKYNERAYYYDYYNGEATSPYYVYYAFGIDLTFTSTICGVESSAINSAYILTPYDFPPSGLVAE